jgi:hypothetical protein
MAAITRVYTIKRAAIMLGISEDLLDRIADTMEPEDGILWICDNTEHGTRGLTDFGIENVLEVLDDPPQLEYFLQDRP